ncbi:MAG TPA: hypothetical protein VF245_02480 [Solirubrobacterales bacterium]
MSFSESELEEICGFVPGEEVWQFQWMLAAADRNLTVLSVDNFDPEGFIANPREELLRQTQDADVVARVFEVSDVAGQIPLVKACLEHSLITFATRTPTFSDLHNALSNTSAVLANVNARALGERDGYAGHVVLIHRDDTTGELILEDPGPPSHEHMAVDKDAFLRAWHSPSPRMANFVSVSITS